MSHSPGKKNFQGEWLAGKSDFNGKPVFKWKTLLQILTVAFRLMLTKFRKIVKTSSIK